MVRVIGDDKPSFNTRGMSFGCLMDLVCGRFSSRETGIEVGEQPVGQLCLRPPLVPVFTQVGLIGIKGDQLPLLFHLTNKQRGVGIVQTTDCWYPKGSRA